MLRIFCFISAIIISVSVRSQLSRIIVHLDSSSHNPLQGRLYIFSATDTSKTVQDPDPFNPSPSFFLDVKNWKGGEIRTVDTSASAFPISLGKLKPGFYKFAAVLNLDTTERSNTAVAGNWYSRDVLTEIKTGNETEIHLYLRARIPARPFRENDSTKLLVLKSSLLSSFHKKDVRIEAGVILPADYTTQPEKKYPLVFIIPGWGGTHYDVFSKAMRKRYGIGMGKEKIYVYLNPETQTRWGLHAFVDSRVNGPWGRALAEELVPLLADQFRITTNRSHHFVVGQSSGGYGALWLQLNYPKSFGGCWAVSPDPVDFADFNSVNLYTDNNMYTDDKGNERPFFSWNGQYISTIKRFIQFEDFMGDGGQMQSFEAEFGLPDIDGKPQTLFDRHTGQINTRVAKSWEAYDMSLFVQNHYRRIKTDVDDKIHVYAGAADNFFLDRSVKLFGEKSARLKAKIKVELFQGANHWTIWNDAFTRRIQQEIDERIK